MKMNRKKTFNDFVSGDGLLNFALTVGVFLLVITYGGIMYRINPNKVNFGYDVLVSIVEAFFFGLATFLVIRQAQKQYIKFVYAMFEGLALFLYYNSPYFGQWANFALTTYISVFGGFTFYSLGYISLYRYRDQLKKAAIEAKKQAFEAGKVILNKDGEPYWKPDMGFTAKYHDQDNHQEGKGKNGYTERDIWLMTKNFKYRDIREKTGWSLGAISRAKDKYENDIQ